MSGQPGMTGKSEHLAEQALSDIRGGLDAIPNLSAAIAQLKIEAGELPADELDGYACDCEQDDCPFSDEDGGDAE